MSRRGSSLYQGGIISDIKRFSMKSGFIYIALLLAICASMYFMYKRSFVTRDFEVINSEEVFEEESMVPEEESVLEEEEQTENSEVTQ